MCCEKNTTYFVLFDNIAFQLYNYSMKTLITSIVALTFSATAVSQSWPSWDNPVAPFDATKGRIHNGPISIEWQLVDDVNKACEKTSRKVGNSGFGGKAMDACAFWWGSTCLIITKKKPTMHDVGHEVRHCFYGAWH